jgi:UDP-N-acetylglucosamine 2-epimerase (non-hydrolysing)
MKKDIKVLMQDRLQPKVGIIIGTRPGIVMFAPIIHEIKNRGLNHFVIHTGQHYSPNMDSQFFMDLNLPVPEFKLEGIGEKKTHGSQTAAMLEGIEEILFQQQPKLVLVGGDANTNLSGALAARKMRIQVGHVEAGERSYDWRMPEEHNRRIIDHISDHLFTTNEKGKTQLSEESVQGTIHVVGNPIVDASLQHLQLASQKASILDRYHLTKDAYAILTTHREENVDFSDHLEGILKGVSEASEKMNLPIIFPVHPRTIKRLKQFEMYSWACSLEGIKLIDAVGYLDFIQLISNSRMVFTDSGGVQQEACIHNVPAVTLRENTEWTETLENNANRLAGTDPERIVKAATEALSITKNWTIPFGNGDAAKNIVNICENILEAK